MLVPVVTAAVMLGTLVLPYTPLAGLLGFTPLALPFLLVILGATDERAPAGFAPIAIGLCLTLIHLISIPVSNTSVNPARSTAVAVYVGDWATAQLWLFWVAPGRLMSATAPPRWNSRTWLNPSMRCLSAVTIGEPMNWVMAADFGATSV